MPGATERDVRRAYATQLKQIDVSKDPATFEVLRGAYEQALFIARYAQPTVSATPEEPIEPPAVSATDTAPLPLREDAASPFVTMRSLVENRDYGAVAWRALLNNPLLDAPEVSARFEHALVKALSENELSTEFTLSAGPDWYRMIESRYAWVADGLRYARQFPLYADLRQTIVERQRPRVAPPRFDLSSFIPNGRILWILAVLLMIASHLGRVFVN